MKRTSSKGATVSGRAGAADGDRRATPRAGRDRRQGDRSSGEVGRRRSGIGSDSIRPFLNAEIESKRLAKPWTAEESKASTKP
jgi:hypothetical protein